MTVNTIYIVWSQGYHTGIEMRLLLLQNAYGKEGKCRRLCPETNCKDNGAQVSSGGKTVDRVEG
jgi:hypothetical protein